ncbi:hypothetical protein [Algoriphagus boseongensis]|uniref:hypothetical protein n=1 Tax=Algoriphagus boseongensis TaxID=1442587 RepID=UPI001061AC38|nr:hypothetical protein [Algoriphagus boseongensis]
MIEINIQSRKNKCFFQENGFGWQIKGQLLCRGFGEGVLFWDRFDFELIKISTLLSEIFIEMGLLL